MPRRLRQNPYCQDGADHLAVIGLLDLLPPIGSVFPDSKRKEWADAAVAVFALIYEPAPETDAAAGVSPERKETP